MAFTKEEKQAIIDEYLAEEPTPDTTIEITKMIADANDVSVNAIRYVLTEAEVYVKKVAATAATTAAGKSGKSGTTRVSKEVSIGELREAIAAKGKEVDEGIITKLTGKAAVYFTSIIKE